MRILFLNSAKEWGGNEKWTLFAAEGLAALGHTVYLGCRSDMFQNRRKNTGLNLIEFPFANAFDVFTLFKIKKFIKKHNIDIVVPTKQREYILGGFAALKKAKIVARFGIDRSLHNFRNRFAFCRLFDNVIVNSTKIISTLGKTKGFDTSKCRLVYNGIAIPELSEETRAKYRNEFNVTENMPMIVCVGRLSPQKGIDYALRAFSVLNKTAPLTRLVIAGAGECEAEYKKMVIDLEIETKITFTGHRDDISGILQAADLFWLTSRSEGMANTLLEAMAHRKASLAFDIAGVKELICDNENGMIVKAWEYDSFAEKSISLLENRELKERIEQNAMETVKEKYTLECSLKSLESIFLEILYGSLDKKQTISQIVS